MSFNFVTTPSNNHASPTGALPFLSTFKLPLDPLQPSTLVPSTKLERWVQSHDFARQEPEGMRYEAYMALLDHRIRHAWVCPYVRSSHRPGGGADDNASCIPFT